jgi:hypothetical protein
MIEEENRRMENLLYKGRGHKITKEELSLIQRKKAWPKSLMESMMEYGKAVADEARKKREEMPEKEEGEGGAEGGETVVTEDERMHVVEREKYHQGVNYGLVKQEIKKTLPL